MLLIHCSISYFSPLVLKHKSLTTLYLGIISKIGFFFLILHINDFSFILVVYLKMSEHLILHQPPLLVDRSKIVVFWEVFSLLFFAIFHGNFNTVYPPREMLQWCSSVCGFYWPIKFLKCLSYFNTLYWALSHRQSVLKYSLYLYI